MACPEHRRVHFAIAYPSWSQNGSYLTALDQQLGECGASSVPVIFQQCYVLMHVQVAQYLIKTLLLVERPERSYSVEIPTKIITYTSVGLCATALVPRLPGFGNW